jgi:lysozyme
MKILQNGDKGDEVLFVQRLLKKVYPSITIDSDFGNKTEEFVKRFQKTNNLLNDGIVGPLTFEALSQKAARNVLGTDVYRHDETSTEAFWQDVERNYWFCFIKASQGSEWTDPRFAEHSARFKDLKILRGAYHFPDLLSSDVPGEVNCFLNSCKNGGIDWKEQGVLPPVYDVEPLNEIQAKEFPSQSKSITSRMKKWLETVEKKTGRTPIIYTSRRVWDELLLSPQGFDKYPLWVANYGTSLKEPKLPSIWKTYAFWQFLDNWTIGGVKGFDVNRLGIALKDLLKMGNY